MIKSLKKVMDSAKHVDMSGGAANKTLKEKLKAGEHIKKVRAVFATTKKKAK